MQYRILVEAWVKQVLVPALKPDQVVVMDNASFHKSATIQILIEQAGCRLLFLPPYAPDLNKIEKFWARLKHYLRKTSLSLRSFGMPSIMHSDNCPDILFD